MVERPILWARDLSRSFKGNGTPFTLIIENVELTRGAQIAVVGPSGCGKSTLLGLLSLALKPDRAGALELAGVDAAELWRRGRTDELTALRSRCIGFVPQTARLLPFLTLGENIALPQRVLRRMDNDLLRAIAHELGIGALLGRRPAEVSVGERQRAAVARALVHRPPVLLADEPTAAVHPAQADEVLALMSNVASEIGAALLITTHDHERARVARFAIAPCRPEPSAATTRFDWSTRPLREAGHADGREGVA